MEDSIADRLKAVMRTPPWGRFQVHGVRFLDRMNGSALLADSCGLGKSWQTIGFLRLRPELRPALIICPSGVKYAWKQQLMEHSSLECEVAESKRPYPLRGNIWVINYDILHDWAPWFLKQGIAQVVCDEAHRIGNLSAKRTIAARAIAKKAQRFIALSGTPVRNRPYEFFSMLNLIAPQVFPSIREYAYAYCGPRRVLGHWVFDGATRLEELHEKIKPFMLRRLKSEVMTELPVTNRQMIPVQIHMKEYIKARNDFIAWLLQNKGADAARRAQSAEKIVRMGHLKRLAAFGKLKAIKTWIEDFFLDNPDQKLLVFSVHREMTFNLEREFPNALKIIGGMTAAQKFQIVNEYQTNPEKSLLLGNIQAAGEGTTLTAGSTMAFTELSWVPAEHEQAEGRQNRIGQKSEHLDAFYFVATGTIEEDIVDILQSKSSVIGQIVDGRPEEHVMNLIIKRLLDKHAA